MKKSILSPLSSAFVIPGLGQILNQQLRKGGLILAAVFFILVAGAAKLFFLIRSVLSGMDPASVRPEEILERMHSQSFLLFWLLLALFGGLWLYSVLDAYLGGREMDRAEKRGGE